MEVSPLLSLAEIRSLLIEADLAARRSTELIEKSMANLLRDVAIFQLDKRRLAESRAVLERTFSGQRRIDIAAAKSVRVLDQQP